MTDADKQLLIDLELGNISLDSLSEQFSVDLPTDDEFISKEMKAAIDSADQSRIRMTMPLIWASNDVSKFVDLLNELLINPNHKRHQEIAKTLQDHAPSPTTVPFIRKALETNFDYLQYTCSDSEVIAKWFS